MFGWHGSDQPTQEQRASRPRLSKSFLTSLHEDWHYSIKSFQCKHVSGGQGSEVTRLNKTTFTNKSKGETQRGKKGKEAEEWKIWLSILSSTPKKLSFHNPVSLSPFLFFSKFFSPRCHIKMEEMCSVEGSKNISTTVCLLKKQKYTEAIKLGTFLD